MPNQTELVHGFHAITTLLKTAPERVQRVFLLKGRRDQRAQKLLAQLDKQRIAHDFVERDYLDRLCDGSHQGVVAQCAPGETRDEQFLKRLLDGLNEPPFLLVLDSVTDPHNLGACLRTAAAAGVHAVIAPKDKAAGINPTVRKVAAGAAELVPFIPVTNLARTLKSLQERGIWTVGSAGEAEKSLYQLDLNGPLAFILGAEGQGLRRLTREHCDFLAAIPMAGSVESLNVSVAVGVCLYEAVRQRQSTVDGLQSTV